MAVKFTSIKCPDCGAVLDIEEGRTQMFCSYCGAKIVMTNENEYIYRHIDEASIKQTEAEAKLRMKELEIEEKENDKSRKNRKIAYLVALLFAVVGVIMIVAGNYIGIFPVVIGGYIALFAYTGGSEKAKRRRAQYSATEVVISEKMRDYEDENYNSVVALYRSAGFNNVSAIPLKDLNILTAKKNGKVEDVAINGDCDFDEGDVFTKSSNVTITYHSL